MASGGEGTGARGLKGLVGRVIARVLQLRLVRAYLRYAQWTMRGGLWVDPTDGVAWPGASAVAIQRRRDEELEASLVPPTPEHAAWVREQVRQIIARPGRKADRKVGR